MCGVTFAFDADATVSELGARTDAALRKLRHRGPDASGLVCGSGWALGHTRLAIIDIATSPQPMWDPSQRYCLAYNGEIYNFRQLRMTLEDRWEFTSSGDTEVVLAGFILKGISFLDEMEGMWAFALWDSLEQRLILARDRMGKKPLFYSSGAKKFWCASELGALRVLTDRDWQEDLDTTADYFRYGYPLPGFTFYRDVREVLPGNVLTWKANRSPTQAAYWQLNPRSFNGTREEAVSCVRESLTNAVNRRLVADVEVGAFLSGGVDSSLVCAIASEKMERRLKTFTIGFSDGAFDERFYARQVASALGTDHYEEELEEWNEDILERLVLERVGQPFADSSLLPTALVSNVAAKKVKVALSGDGADECFSGYQRYQARVLLQWYLKLPAGLRRLAQHAVRALPEPMVHHSRSVLKKAHLFIDIVEQNANPYVAPTIFPHSDFETLFPELVGFGHEPPAIPETIHRDDVQQMMLRDALIYLPQDILVKVDRASMASSLETRSPFLDKEVVEFAFSLPRQWHRSGLSGKQMLRSAFRDHLPAAVWRRRKQGFSAPVHQWFREGKGEKLRELLAAKATPVKVQPMLEILRQHASGLRDRGHGLWVVYAYLLWRHLSFSPEDPGRAVRMPCESRLLRVTSESDL